MMYDQVSVNQDIGVEVEPIWKRIGERSFYRGHETSA
jgi:hypothetical protein